MDNLFFLVSKLAWALLSPLNIIIALTCLTTLLLWLNKIALAKVVLSFLLLINLPILIYPVGDYLIYPLEKRFSKPVEMPTDIDGIIILGGAEELKVSVSWQRAEVSSAADRFIAAAELALMYPDVPVIYSGGSGLLRFQTNDGTGESISKTLLTNVGIEQSRLIIESQSHNTDENFLLLKPLLPKINGNYFLVTSAFHMPRSVGIAEQRKINVVPYPVDFRSNTPALRQLAIDYRYHIDALEIACREWIGLTVYYLTGKTESFFPKPKPKPKPKP